jgi:hypothetical protein
VLNQAWVMGNLLVNKPQLGSECGFQGPVDLTHGKARPFVPVSPEGPGSLSLHSLPALLWLRPLLRLPPCLICLPLSSHPNPLA